jgi:lipid II:glycine glycyltransferase (peptidoglycan interpeptide bridge formation enzyme)
LGFYENGQLINALQLTLHKIPILGKKIAYIPRGFLPDQDQIAGLKNLAKKYNIIFSKIEPNVFKKVNVNDSAFEILEDSIKESGGKLGKPSFGKYTFYIDLNHSKTDLMAKMSSKTRYNIRLAQKKGVEIVEDSSKDGMETYIKILTETTRRQGFYAHNPNYFRTLWKVMGDSGMVKIFHAIYKNQVLASWIIFHFNDMLYYPYGSSRTIHKKVMASNLMLWQMILYGKSQNCRYFDLWGCLGPNPNPNDPWIGFHRFKKGYGGDIMESLGTYDLVYSPVNYALFNLANNIRWSYLKLKTKINI